MHWNFKKLSPEGRLLWNKIFTLLGFAPLMFTIFFLTFAHFHTAWTENLPASLVFSLLTMATLGILLFVRFTRWAFPSVVILLFGTFYWTGANGGGFFFIDLLPFCPVSTICVDNHWGTGPALFLAVLAGTMLMFDCIFVVAPFTLVGAIYLKLKISGKSGGKGKK